MTEIINHCLICKYRETFIDDGVTFSRCMNEESENFEEQIETSGEYVNDGCTWIDRDIIK